MSHFIKMINPLKIAKLSTIDYQILMQAVEIINGGTSEEQFPDELFGKTFLIMSEVGPDDVRCWTGMKVIAAMVRDHMLTITRLRASIH